MVVVHVLVALRASDLSALRTFRTLALARVFTTTLAQRVAATEGFVDVALGATWRIAPSKLAHCTASTIVMAKIWGILPLSCFLRRYKVRTSAPSASLVRRLPLRSTS